MDRIFSVVLISEIILGPYIFSSWTVYFPLISRWLMTHIWFLGTVYFQHIFSHRWLIYDFWGPYIFSERTVYFPHIFSHRWLIYDFWGPYIFSERTVYFQREDCIFSTFEDRIFSPTVYFQRNDRIFSAIGPYIFNVWGPYIFADRIF